MGDVPKQTRGWDEVDADTRLQRSKEESSDYRYFPDPDLVPVTVTAEEVERIRASLGGLPAQLAERLERDLRPDSLRQRRDRQPGRAAGRLLCRAGGACGDGKLASNWIQQDVLRTLNEQQIAIDKYPGRAPRHWAS